MSATEAGAATWTAATGASARLPEGVLALLAAYVHPAFVLPRAQIATALGLAPLWNNSAYAQLQRLHENDRVKWQDGCLSLVQRALQVPRGMAVNAATCTALCGPYTTVVTLLDDDHVVVTTARVPDAGASEEPHIAVESDTPEHSPHVALKQLDVSFRDELTRTPMGRRILVFAWGTTSLGALDHWLSEIKASVLFMLSSPDCMALWYGDEHIGLYNDAYVKVLGRKHPEALGRSFKIVHKEIYADLQEDALRALAGHTVHHQHTLLMIDRDETLSSANAFEEVYYTWSYVPARARYPDGKLHIFGLINNAVETTSEVIANRRLQVLSSLQKRTTRATTVADFYPACIAALEENPHDIPFALLYTARPEYSRRDKHGGEPEKYRLALAGALGVPPDHPSAPQDVVVYLNGRDDCGTSDSQSTAPSLPERFAATSTELVRGDSSTSSVTINSTSSASSHHTFGDDLWSFAEALNARGDVVPIPQLGALSDGFARRGWDEPCSRAVTFSIGGKDQPPDAVLVLGMNPRRPYDEELVSFVRMLGSQLSTGLTTVIDCETQVQRVEELASLDRAKTTFFSNVSHELRTPLTLILGPLEDVLASGIDVRARALLEVVQRNATRLHHLVNTLLDFARLEAGRYLGHIVPVQFGQLTENFASLFRSAIERGGVEYVVDCAEEGPSVYLDPDSWEKIVTNIVSNAFKYCLKGKIEVRVHYTRREAIFSCKDTGCGIPQDELENIFQRFHRVASTGRSHEGTGIGLSLAHETVKALGGRFEVESEYGEGSTFRVILPLGTEHIPPDRLESEPTATSGRGRAQTRYGARMVEEAGGWVDNEQVITPAASMRSGPSTSDGTSETAFELNMLGEKRQSPIIVLADDNADLRQYCTSLLSPKYTVHVFSDGRAALEYVRTHDVDLILSDVEMPRLDGFGFLAAVRESMNLNLLPFILLSARAGSEARVDGLNAGADDYLVKPFSSKELLARVKTHVDLGQRRRELEARVRDRTRLLIESEGQLRLKVAEEQHMRKQQEIVVDLTSHELRNPLNATWQNAEMVEEALDRLRPVVPPEGLVALDEAQDAIESIALSVAHQTRIADDILNFSKISMQLLTIHKTSFPIFDTIQDVCRLWEVETRERNVKLDLTATDGVKGTWIHSDPQRISQITINFLLNALRFTAGCAERHISVSIRLFEHVQPPGKNTYRVTGDKAHYRDGSWLQIAVRDTGPGLSVEDLKKLFERFAQAHPSKDQFSGGHGLGLFVSRHIVSLLGGFIDVESVEGQGATFSFSIPAERAEPVERKHAGWRARILGRSARRGALVEKIVPAPPTADELAAAPRHVLVVEDNVINQKVLVRQLQAKGFKTSAASHGQEALDLLLGAENDVDVVLMDIEMPVKDGKAACIELRAAERAGRRRMPVIAVTGNAREEQVQECLALGFDEVAIKPYRITDIVRLIGSVLAVAAH